MSQNFAARVALAAGGGVGFLKTDAQGRLLTTSDASEPSAVMDSSGDVAAAAAIATLPGVSGKTNFLSGFILAGSGATAASVVLVTITGLLGGTVTMPIGVPAGAAVGITPIICNFENPLPAADVNTDIVVTMPSLGVGNLHASATAWGTVV